MATRKPRNPKFYLVYTPTGVKLVKALSSQSAIKHTVLDTHRAEVASQEDLIKHRDLPIIDATAEAEQGELL
jgi:hypothetical protein